MRQWRRWLVLCTAWLGSATPVMADSGALQSASAAEAQGHHSVAVVFYTQALLDSSLSAGDRRAAYMGRGLAHGNSGDFADAISDFSQAIALNPKLADGYYDRALSRSQIGEYSAALLDLNVVESSAGAYPRYYYYRGYIDYQNQDYDAAIADLSKAAATSAQEPDVFYYRARAYAVKTEREQAMGDFRTAIDLKPTDEALLYSAYRWHGTEAFALKRYNEAAADFDALLQHSPQDADASMRRAYLHFDQGDYPATIADASKVIHAETRIEAGSVIPWPGVLDPFEVLSDRIVEQYNRGIRGLGLDPYALAIRARANRQLGRKDAALADYAMAVRAIPPGADDSVAVEMAAARR